MRISDWSSDVCSSDLRRHPQQAAGGTLGQRMLRDQLDRQLVMEVGFFHNDTLIWITPGSCGLTPKSIGPQRTQKTQMKRSGQAVTPDAQPSSKYPPHPRVTVFETAAVDAARTHMRH